jgi:hypothetical protein
VSARSKGLEGATPRIRSPEARSAEESGCGRQSFFAFAFRRQVPYKAPFRFARDLQGGHLGVARRGQASVWPPVVEANRVKDSGRSGGSVHRESTSSGLEDSLLEAQWKHSWSGCRRPRLLHREYRTTPAERVPKTGLGRGVSRGWPSGDRCFPALRDLTWKRAGAAGPSPGTFRVRSAAQFRFRSISIRRCVGASLKASAEFLRLST